MSFKIQKLPFLLILSGKGNFLLKYNFFIFILGNMIDEDLLLVTLVKCLQLALTSTKYMKVGKCQFNYGPSKSLKWKDKIRIEIIVIIILWKFKIQTDQPIQGRKADLVIVNNENKACHILFVVTSVDNQEKIKRNEKYKYRQLKKP